MDKKACVCICLYVLRDVVYSDGFCKYVKMPMSFLVFFKSDNSELY